MHHLVQAELMPLSAARMSEEVVSVKLPEPIGSQEHPNGGRSVGVVCS